MSLLLQEASRSPPPEPQIKKAGYKEKVSWVRAFEKAVLKNRTTWGLADAYFLINLLRSSEESWYHFWLQEASNIGLADAAHRVSGLELGSTLDTSTTGIVSDTVEGRRVLVIIGCLAGVVVAFAAT